ncbi:MAG TPA: BTAD domain-containing putative transcriptional regulator [Acidimicrobiales bacterium]|nr:BTAD domain-containing putative transcriptional regulator [Acidimicrobiales bacterium]
MDFRVLGPFEVHDGGDVVAVGAFRQRAVLALLTIHAGEALSTDRIIEEVWAGAPPPSALRTLHAYVSRLRGVLHAGDGSGGRRELLQSRHPGYVLAVDPSEIDAVRFDRAVDRAAEALAEGGAEEAAGDLREALGLWRGTAFADFAYEPFAATESQRLMERRLQAVELRIDADLALARHAPVAAELEGLVAEHPMRERLWAQLMTALYRCGRQADALAAYGRVRRALVEELGIEPGPELRLLERLVLEQSPELAWHPVERRSPSSAAALPSTRAPRDPPGAASGERPGTGGMLLPLVGRDGQVEQLMGVLGATVRDGVPRLTVVMGEAGCGKSRLLAEFRARAAAEGVLVATGSAERGMAMPYAPFADMVRDVLDTVGAGALERVGHLRADLSWLVPELGPQADPPGDDLWLARSRLVEAMLQFFVRAGSGEPLLLLLDDAHRMGEGVASVVHAILDRRWPRPVVIVAAVRTERGAVHADVDVPLLDLLKRDETTTVDVGRLTEAELVSLMQAMDQDGAAADRDGAAAWLFGQTAGIALLVREVLAAGPVTSEPSPTHASPQASVSPLVERVIGRRLQRISEDARRLLGTAAVAGMQFDMGLLAALSERDPWAVTEWLEEALEAGLVVETDVLDAFAFDHGLIRDVALGSISHRRQLLLHARAAGLLAERGAAVDAARHALTAYPAMDTEVMVGLVVGGAARAVQQLDFETARVLCAGALAQADAALDPGARSDLLLHLGRAQSLIGNLQDAEVAWATAADLARAMGDDERLARIAVGTDTIGRVTVGASDLRWALLTEALERTGPTWTPLRLRVARDWFLEAAAPHRRVVSPAFVDEVVDAAKELGDPQALAAAYHVRHYLARSRQMSERVQWADELVDVAEGLGAGEWLFEARLAKLIDAAAGADGPGMDRSLDELRQACAGHRTPRALWTYELAAASCARLRGSFEVADEHVVTANAIGERHGNRDNPAAMGAVAFVDAYHRGGLGGLYPVVQAVAALTPEVPAFTLGAGVAAAAGGDRPAARSALARGLEALRDEPEEVWLAAVCLAAELVERVGADEVAAKRLLRLLGPRTGQFAVVGVLSSEFGPTDRCLGLLEAALGDADAADAAFVAALDACRRLGARPWELRTRTDRLVVARGAGRPDPEDVASLQAELEAAGLGGALERLRCADGRG